MLQLLCKVREKALIGFVGGSDLIKARQQLGHDCLDRFDFCFPENGLLAYHNGKEIARQNLVAHLGEGRLQELINWTLRYIADLEIPVKRGTFVEFRTGMLNISPIGRNCSPEERDAFEVYDAQHKVRESMMSAMRSTFAHLDLTLSVGGQISFDVFPRGWDKTFCLRHVQHLDLQELNLYATKLLTTPLCLRHVQHLNLQEVHFFGDKTDKGGNDYEIFEDPRTIGHHVDGPDDTITIINQLFDLCRPTE